LKNYGSCSLRYPVAFSLMIFANFIHDISFVTDSGFVCSLLLEGSKDNVKYKDIPFLIKWRWLMCSNSPVIKKIKRTLVVPKLHISFHEKCSLLASFYFSALDSIHNQSYITVSAPTTKPQMYFVDWIYLLLWSWLAPFESKTKAYVLLYLYFPFSYYCFSRVMRGDTPYMFMLHGRSLNMLVQYSLAETYTVRR
jgi:hypothetical protein